MDDLGNTKNKVKYRNGIKKDNKIIIRNEDILFYENNSIWNKIYKKEVITKNNIQLLEDTSADDLAFTIEYFLNCEKLVYLEDYYGYHWNIYSDSLSHTVKPDHIYELLKTYDYICNKLKEKNKFYLINQVMKNHISYLILQSTFLKCNEKEFKEILNKIYNFEKKINFSMKLEKQWENIINTLIMSNHLTLSIIILKSIDLLRNSKILRQINRILHN